LDKGFTGREVRYLLLTPTIARRLILPWTGLQGVRTALARIDECLGKLREMLRCIAEPEMPSQLINKFSEALDDD